MTGGDFEDWGLGFGVLGLGVCDPDDFDDYCDADHRDDNINHNNHDNNIVITMMMLTMITIAIPMIT